MTSEVTVTGRSGSNSQLLGGKSLINCCDVSEKNEHKTQFLKGV